MTLSPVSSVTLADVPDLYTEFANGSSGIKQALRLKTKAIRFYMMREQWPFSIMANWKLKLEIFSYILGFLIQRSMK